MSPEGWRLAARGLRRQPLLMTAVLPSLMAIAGRRQGVAVEERSGRGAGLPGPGQLHSVGATATGARPLQVPGGRVERPHQIARRRKGGNRELPPHWVPEARRDGSVVEHDPRSVGGCGAQVGKERAEPGARTAPRSRRGSPRGTATCPPRPTGTPARPRGVRGVLVRHQAVPAKIAAAQDVNIGLPHSGLMGETPGEALRRWVGSHQPADHKVARGRALR